MDPTPASNFVLAKNSHAKGNGIIGSLIVYEKYRASGNKGNTVFCPGSASIF
jgi:hypothetical protein